MSDVEIHPLGPDGALIRFADSLSEQANRAALAYRAALDATRVAGVVETATSLTSVFVRFRPDQINRAALVARLGELTAAEDWLTADLPEGRTRWHIPAIFEGEAAPDLDDVARDLRLDPDDAVAELAAASLRVLALGFAPGQPYLGFLPKRWDLPRRTEVTPEVPQGAVVVAVRQVIPFANAAPTGWRQIGRTGFRCYDPKLDPPLPLTPGDEVQFQPVPPSAWPRIAQAPYGDADREVIA